MCLVEKQTVQVELYGPKFLVAPRYPNATYYKHTYTYTTLHIQ